MKRNNLQANGVIIMSFVLVMMLSVILSSNLISQGVYPAEFEGSSRTCGSGYPVGGAQGGAYASGGEAKYVPVMGVNNSIYNAGWNLISVPRCAEDMSVATLFPTATSDAFSYVGYYKYEDTVMPFKGYWLKFASAQSVSMTGYELTSGIIPVVDGWNMIGSLSVPIPVSSITSDPPGLEASDFFGYDGSYRKEDTVMPFKGYWLKANGPGNLILSTTQSAAAIAKNAIKIVHTSEMPPPPPDGKTAKELAIPKEYGLQQAYPNPFNPTTTIKYELPNESKVTLKVYNPLGQVVAVLVEGVQAASYKYIEWNAGAVSSGVYFYKLEATSIADPNKFFVQVKKMLLLK